MQASLSKSTSLIAICVTSRRLAACVALVLAVSLPAFSSRVVTDGVGRKVTLPDHIQRIVCLTPSVADTVYAVGAGAEVVGVSDYTLYPPAARQKPSVGDILRPSLERIAILHPDLVIGVSPMNRAETVRGVEQLGIPLFLVNPVGLEGLYESIGSIGKAIGRAQEATKLVADLRTRVGKIQSHLVEENRPSVFLAISISPCVTAGHRAFITELLAVGGARSVTDDLAQEWITVNVEAIVSRRPDFVLLMRNSPFGLKELTERPGWKSLDAVRMGHVLRIDDRLQYPSPVAFDALEDFARQLRSAETR